MVIPALKPTLDPSLVQDKSLCPVRALRYYLDKTKDLRKGKKLLFVAIKEGYSKDISKATISSWIKQSIILAYQKLDQEVQNVSQVKAHEVRALAPSLAFKGGVVLLYLHDLESPPLPPRRFSTRVSVLQQKQ